MLGRWWRRRTAGRPVPFDAVLDLDVASLVPGVVPEAAMTAVEGAVRGVPGAGLIRVRVRPAAAAVVVRVFAPGTSLEPAGAAWAELRRRLLELAAGAVGVLVPEPVRETRRAMAPMAREVPAPGPGFAEAPAVRYGEGLAALAALAAMVSAAEAPSGTEVEGDEDAERLAQLLRLVLPGDGRAAAAAAVRRFGGFASVLAAAPGELQGVPGLGPHCVAAIKLVHEAALRLSRAEMAGQRVLSDQKRLTDYLTDYLTAALARERVEQFRVLFLDGEGMLLADEMQASGTVNHTPVYPREVVRRALELRADSVVLVHNHPSGDPTPSRDDIEMTRQVALAARVLRIGLRDHIIVGNGRSTSFRAEGLLP